MSPLSFLPSHFQVVQTGASPYGGAQCNINTLVFCDGYLIRKVLPSSVVEEGQNLPLEEIAKWNQVGVWLGWWVCGWGGGCMRVCVSVSECVCERREMMCIH